MKRGKGQKALGSQWRIVFELDLQLSQQSETDLSLHEEKGESLINIPECFLEFKGKHQTQT